MIGIDTAFNTLLDRPGMDKNAVVPSNISNSSSINYEADKAQYRLTTTHPQ